MKTSKLLVVLAFIFSMTALAASSGGTEDVSSLKYFTGEGGWFFKPTINSSLSKKLTNIEGFGNLPASIDTYSYKTLGIHGDYGFMKSWAVEYSTHYVIKDSYSSKPTTGDAEITKDKMGLTAPTIGTKYRYSEGEIINDLYIDWKTAFSKQTISRPTTAGNELEWGKPAGHTFEIGSKWWGDDKTSGGVWGLNPYIRAALQGNWEYKDVVLNAAASQKVSGTTEADFTYGANFSYRKHFDKLYGGLSAKFQAPNTVTQKSSEVVVVIGPATTTTAVTTGTKIETNTPFHITPKAVVGYSMDSHMAFDATFGYDSYKMTTVVSDSTGSVSQKTNTTVKDINLVLGMNYHL